MYNTIQNEKEKRGEVMRIIACVEARSVECKDKERSYFYCLPFLHYLSLFIVSGCDLNISRGLNTEFQGGGGGVRKGLKKRGRKSFEKNKKG